MAEDSEKAQIGLGNESSDSLPEAKSPYYVDSSNVGELFDSDGFGRFTGTCQDTIEIWLKVRDDRIVKASFWTNGCVSTIMASDAVCRLATDKTIAEALQITPKDVLDYVGGLPEESAHCAVLAVNTLKLAIMDYISRKSEPPWKMLYRKKF